MKKVLSVFVAIVFLFSGFLINSFAMENENTIKETYIVVNEWDEYKR